jgi:hypothetical protein
MQAPLATSLVQRAFPTMLFEYLPCIVGATAPLSRSTISPPVWSLLQHDLRRAEERLLGRWMDQRRAEST